METLTKHFREITKAAFAKHGFAQGDVITHWAEIVGSDLAEVSAPERIKWPRGSGEEAQKSGGTLVIRAAPGRALDLQYATTRIITRINSFFGYGAIAKLKVVQATELPSRAPGPVSPEIPKPVCEQQLAELDDGPLKAALERLGKGIAKAGPSSPHDK
jgi:hypothetical protein